LDGSRSIDRSKRFGIRSVKLVQKNDEEGETFIFEINGAPIFCKGANWIPADSFLPRVTREDYEDLLSLAVGANMNMLRIWGGGIYESDDFFELSIDRSYSDNYDLLPNVDKIVLFRTQKETSLEHLKKVLQVSSL
jgi:beta-mannosidase